MNGLSAFLGVFIISTGIAAFMLIYSFKKKLRTRHASNNASRRKTTEQIERWIFRGLAAFFLICFTIPMTSDILNIAAESYITSSGIITSCWESHGRHQLFPEENITLDNGKSFKIYFGPKLEKGERVIVSALPNSKFVMDVRLLVNKNSN